MKGACVGWGSGGQEVNVREIRLLARVYPSCGSVIWSRCVVEGGLDFGLTSVSVVDLCSPARWLWCTTVAPVAGVGILSCPEILLVLYL